LCWHGSKRALAPTIVALLPKGYERMLYVEPFCGSCAVLYAKRPSHAEVVNDLDGDLINFLTTVKLHPRELVRTLRLLPNSRALFAGAIDSKYESAGAWPLTPVSSIHRAARFCYLSHTSFGGLREYWAPRSRNSASGSNLPKRSTLPELQVRLYQWALRLAAATVECAPWQECLEKYDSPVTLFYLDPPYLGTEGYHSGAFGDADWRELRARLATIKGKFLLSAEGTAVMKLLWRGYHQRLTSVTSCLGPNRRKQKELLVRNYDIS
jgi:DNA adenine methylase